MSNNENIKINNDDKSLSKNNVSKFNQAQNKQKNIIDSQINNINISKKRGINLVINGQLENKMTGNKKSIKKEQQNSRLPLAFVKYFSMK